MSQLTDVPLSEIILDERLQMREGMSPETVAEYAEITDQLPPGKIVLGPNGENWLVDGWHTFHGHQAAGKDKMRCHVLTGYTFADAFAMAAAANAKHGLRRRPGDKRRAVTALLSDSTWKEKSDRMIAEACHVSNTYVGEIRKQSELSTVDSSKPAKAKRKKKRVGKDGKERPAAAGKIVLCPFCARRQSVGKPLIADCPDCKTLKKGEKQEAKTEERRAVAEDASEEIYDDEENTVPGALRLIFADSQLYIEAARALDVAAKILESLEKSPGYIMGNKRLNAGESANVDRNVYSTMCRGGAAKMRAIRPAEVHAECVGKNCKECAGKEYFTASETGPHD